jgi:hypothetical protein
MPSNETHKNQISLLTSILRLILDKNKKLFWFSGYGQRQRAEGRGQEDEG